MWQAAARLWVQRAPGISRALVCKGEEFFNGPSALRRGVADACLGVIAV